MKPTEPLQLHHSWPLFERGRRFDLGWVCNGRESAFPLPGKSTSDDAVLNQTDIGRWTCDLSDNSLTWSAKTFDIFGLPRNARLSRAETAAMYCEDARAAMERLRAYAIKHRRGFTLDAQIRPATGGLRWMRLMAAPICEAGRVVRLNGVKLDVSDEYH